MKDIRALLACLFVIFILISLLSVDRNQNSGLVTSHGKIGSERLISLFYIYPFRCQPCGHRFRLLQWGVTYTKIEEDQRVGRKRKESIDKHRAGSRGPG